MTGNTTPAKVYFTDSDDPWFNLAVEDMLFREMDPSGHILMLWRNSPAIVIGRFQNPWLECRLGEMYADGVGLARRQSGGGAVYHDAGNLNFTFMSGRNEYDPGRNLKIIIEALENAGIKAEVNKRNDILAGGKKVSGSAFRIIRDRAFHHGTLLIDSDLGKLLRYLNPEVNGIKSKGTKSVKGDVVNLRGLCRGLTVENTADHIRRVFLKYFGAAGEVAETDIIKQSKAEKLISVGEYCRQMKSPEWLYGKCPEFSVITEVAVDGKITGLELTVREAVIKRAAVVKDLPCESAPMIPPEMMNRLVSVIVGTLLEKNALERVSSAAGLDCVFNEVPLLPSL